MRKIFLFLFLLTGIMCNAQKIRFEYDSAGNQIQRRWCPTCSSKTSSTDYLEESKITDSDLQKFFPEDVISYYPNPVKETLFLKWEVTETKIVNSVQLFALNGQLIKEVKISVGENQSSFSFIDLPQGIYILNLIYSDGDQKSIKIIKDKN